MQPSRVEPADRELMARLAAGEREALAPLMERHYRRVYRVALSYLRQREDAGRGQQQNEGGQPHSGDDP